MNWLSVLGCAQHYVSILNISSMLVSSQHSSSLCSRGRGYSLSGALGMHVVNRVKTAVNF